MNPVRILWALAALGLLASPSARAQAPNITATQADTFTPNGAGRATPGNNITYGVQINNTGGAAATNTKINLPTPTNTTLVATSIRTTCLAINDTYSALGNVSITIPAGTGVLANDTDPDNLGGGTLTATAIVGGATTQGGTVTLNTNGGFTYNPPAGFVGADTFSYTLNDGDDAPSTNVGTVTINITGMIWFIDENAGSDGDGRLATPFNNLASFQAINNGAGNNPKAGQSIFLYESADDYTGGITLLGAAGGGQRLIGQDATSDLATLAGVTPPTGSAALPTMNSGNATVARVVNSGGNGVMMGLNSRIHGFTAGNASGNAVNAVSVGTIHVSDVAINSNGQALLAANMTFAAGAAFTSITSIGGANGIGLSNVGGSVNLGTGALSGHSSNSFSMSTGTGSASYAGSITKTSGLGFGVSVSSKSGGTVTLSGAISVTTASGVTGVSLTSNTGTTINLTGGVSVSTGSGNAFVATGGGIVTVTGTTNTLATTTGTALNVANTTIGASGLNFRSISSNGAANGIVLNNTGTSGGLTVSGDGGGSNNGSGGTIQNSTGVGVSLTTTQNVSLNYLNVTASGDDGIAGSGVTGFTMNRSNVTNNGNALNEDGVDFGGTGLVTLNASLSGTATVTNSQFTGNYFNQFTVRKDSGTATITLTGCTFTGRAAENNNNDGLFFEALGTATITGTAQNSSFAANKGDHFQAAGVNSGNLNLIYQSNTHTGGHSTALGQGITINAATGVAFGGYTGDVTYDINGNTFTGAISNSVTVGLGTSGASASFTGKIRNNLIGTSGASLTGSTQANGISVDARGNGTHTCAVTNNTIRQCFDRGILAEAGDGNPVLNLTVTGNIIDQQVDPNAREAIQTNFGITSTNVFGEIDTPVVSLTLGGAGALANTFSHGGGAPDDFRLRKRFECTVALPGYGGGTGQDATSLSQVVAFIQGQNTGSAGEPGSASASGTGGGYTGGPSTPLPPLLFAPEELANFDLPAPTSVESAIAWSETVRERSLPAPATQSDPIRPNPTLPDVAPVASALTQSQLDTLVTAARERWEATGLSEAQRTALEKLTFSVVDLPGWYLGEASSEGIRIDDNAGGNGWFIDETPSDDSEFAGANVSSFKSQVSSSAAKRVDLLTTLMHEMGHSLGLCDSYDPLRRRSVMYGFLTSGERRLPKVGEAKGAVPHLHSEPHYLGGEFTIGTLPAGKSITITFQTTINTTPTTFTSISSQGTVTADDPDGGGPLLAPNVLTDDPVPGGATDPTVTPVEQLPTLTNIAKGTNEDTTMSFTAANFDAGFSDVNAGDTLQTLRITSLPASGLLQNNGVTILVGSLPLDIARANIGLLTFVPAADANGATSFSWSASDGNGFASATALVNLTITAINDEPTLDTITSPAAIPEDSGQQTVNLAGIGEGAGNESAQTLTITASSDNIGLVTNPVTVNYTDGQSTGSVQYTPVANAHGTAIITVTVQDSGGAPGDDTITRQFTVQVNPVADTPSITSATTLPNTQTTSGLVVTRNAADGAEVTHVKVTNIANGSLFLNNGTTAVPAGSFVPYSDASMGFKFTPALNFQGDATFDIQASTSNVDGGLGGAVVTATISVSERVSIDTVNAGDNDANESGNTGLFTFKRGGSAGVLVANFELDGFSTATAADFSLAVVGSGSVSFAGSAGTVTFPDTVTTVTVALTAIAETPNAAEPAETVRFNIVPVPLPGPGAYQAGTPNNATVTIAQNGFVVTTTNDGGQGSLRQAILNANGIAGTDTISFDIAGAGPHVIELVTALPNLDSNLTIAGSAGEAIVVDGDLAVRPFTINAGRTVTISRLTITRGSGAGNGGGIHNSGTLVLLECAMDSNASTGLGGAIFSETGSSLTLVSSAITNNLGSGGGGAMWINNTSSLLLVNSTISGNTTPESGGGFIVFPGATADIRSTTITNNRSNTGGGGGPSGGIGNFGTVTMHNSIVAGNFNGAGTTAGDFQNSPANPASSNNLIGTGGNGGLSNGVNGNQVGVADALLGTLQDNGGATLTHALLAGSTALNAGNNANLPADTFDLDGDLDFLEPIPFDQRGPGFLRAIGTVDIGAFELQKSVSITALDAVKNEGNSGTTNFTFTISRTGPTTGDVTTTYTVGGAGVNGTDFTGGTLPTSTATITDGNTSTTISIPVAGDTTRESNEAFTVTLSAPNNGYVVSGSPAAGTINNDDFEADLSITKTDGAATEVPGTPVTYTITAGNAGPDPATATVADTFPGILSGATWTSVGAGGGTVAASGSGNINEPVNLPAGGSVTFTVTANIAASATGSLVNTASVAIGAGVTDPDLSNNSATDTDTLTPQSDLSITKTDGVATATPGGSVTYTITVSNAGPSDAPGSTVADTFPAVLTGTWTGVGAGGGTGTAAGAGNINDTVNLPVGGSFTYTVSASISPAATGTLSNTATAATAGGVTDLNPANNSATDNDTLTPMSDLSITKTDGVATAVPGGSVTYTITASNAGPSSVVGATVADTFPAILTGTWTAVGAGGGTATASGSGNINDTVNLPVGGSVTYTVSATINSSATGSLTNTATVSSAVTDPDPGNNSATDTDTLTPQADLSITKTDGVSIVTPGGTVTYTITASNAGPSNAPGATVADTLPASLSGVTWTGVGAGGGTATAAGAGNINDTVNLPAGGSVTYTVTGTLDNAAFGSLSNTATVAAPGGVTDSNPPNNSATDTDNISTLVTITATDKDADEITPGTATWRVSRNGSSGELLVDLEIDATSTVKAADWTQVGANFATSEPGDAGTVTIPDGLGFVDIVLTPVDDENAELDETVILSVTGSALYTVATVPAVDRTVTIARNDFGVTNTDDAGEGSLRLAIENANLLPGADIVTFLAPLFADAVPDTIVMGGTEFQIAETVTIAGTGADLLTISGNGASRIFNVGDFIGTFVLSDLALVDGSATGGGNAGGGGAIFKSGPSSGLILERCLVSDNAAETFGGAIVVQGGGVSIRDSAIVNNLANGNASGGGGISNQGDMTILNTTISGNSAPNATTDGGGGILNAGTLTLLNSTVTGNRINASIGGGGIDAAGTETIRHSIVAGNFEGVASDPSDVEGGTIDTAFHVLIGDAGTAGGIVHGTSGNLVGDAGAGTIAIASVLDPVLGVKGGVLPVHSLVAGSPAVDAGDPAFDGSTFTPALDFDQRGAGFVRVVKGSSSSAAAIVDLGAFELNPAPVFTNRALRVAVSGAPINLATATGPTPPGGTFTGPGVVGRWFNPRGLRPGVYQITYTVVDAFGVRNAANFTVTVVSNPARLTVTIPQRFEPTKVGTVSRTTRIIYVRNIGGEVARNLLVSQPGRGRKNFIVTQTAARNLAPGAFTVFRAVFRPLSAGEKRERVTVSSGRISTSLVLSGLGRLPLLRDPDRLLPMP